MISMHNTFNCVAVNWEIMRRLSCDGLESIGINAFGRKVARNNSHARRIIKDSD